MMDIPSVLAVLRPTEPWGPCSNSSSTYEDLTRTWPGPTPVPTRAEMLAAWQQIEANGGLAALDQAREPATKKAIRQRAAQALTDIETFLALSTPNAAQVRDQVRLNAQILRVLIPRLLEI